MKIVFLALFAYFSFSYGKKEVTEVKIWRIGSGSVIEIAGSTNFSSFRCESSKYLGGDVLKETYFPDRHLSEWSGEIILRTANFDCFNAVMTNDFRETLQIGQYPTISVRFLKLRKDAENINQENLNGEIEITLAGVSKIYPISCVFLVRTGGSALLAGERKLTFTDFELDPPVKLLGTLRVRDSIEVNFGLELEEQI